MSQSGQMLVADDGNVDRHDTRLQPSTTIVICGLTGTLLPSGREFTQ
ncbi:hypothetical protein QN362_05405 [Actimicrobium sp. CCC2.4]|nr:hypothetical protein [Actimicrobium sp. CCC2.4]MEB0134763.1 hypothetical protein [Actimicrobium sp. CCC2.4]WPX30702.1 hypothetical protein RHM62_10490 [Actimicrobium sp. CCC2.4]